MIESFSGNVSSLFVIEKEGEEEEADGDARSMVA